MNYSKSTQIQFHLTHGGTASGIWRPTPLHDAPQARAYHGRLIEGAVTLLNDLDDSATIWITVIRLLVTIYLRTVSGQYLIKPACSPHLVDNARPRIHISLRAHRQGIEQLFPWFVAPCSRCRFVNVVGEPTHENVEKRVGNTNPAIVLNQNVCLER
jgi:hypothetical protein